jgi:urea carboxylase
MFDKVLIANRGVIACRILRTLRRLRIASVAVCSDADRNALHAREADDCVELGGLTAAESYLRADRILEAARSTGAQAIHPGYGFLSENARFAADCERAGIVFIGPTAQQIRDFGLKHAARALAGAHGLPLLPGSALLAGLAHALAEAERIGYPVMLKSTAGGGGIGMQPCFDEQELRAAFETVRRMAHSNFSDGGVLLEKLVERARHIEVQLFGDGRGEVVALGERDCSTQRRNQKIIEETPAPGLSAAFRDRLAAAAVALGRAVQYRSAGTVEFVVDAERDEFYFLEVNTRLQVEHGVTEAVLGIDLVEWMLRLAAGEPLPRVPDRPAAGVAIQARLYAEDPARGFRPASGLLAEVALPHGVRVESCIESGSEVPAFYDPLLAKLIAHASTRAAAIEQLDAALAETVVYGIETNREYLREILSQPLFRAGAHTTRFLQGLSFSSRTVEVVHPGTHTTVQDWPGRQGYWNVGVPPSGPMDELAFRLANRLVGNPEGAAALELTVTGPTLRFGCDAHIALTGASMRSELDGEPVEFWRVVPVRAGSTLRVEAIDGAGLRTYLAVRGGFDIPRYMGSRATFTLGHFGGHVGRALRSCDVLRIGAFDPAGPIAGEAVLPPTMLPHYQHEWDIAVLHGPQGAPDFFTEQDIRQLFSTAWQVHYNSSRTGVRLLGPKPQWARHDGGEAGLHPSNIHDNAYAIGTLDFTGDMPVILGPDGPSLGGFVCPATIARAQLWKIGQLRAGDRVRFRPISAADAEAERIEQDQSLRTLRAPASRMPSRRGALVPSSESGAAVDADHTAILARRAPTPSRPAVYYRQSGEDNILIEYGEPVLDLALRFRVQALLDRLESAALPGILDLTPGVRSLQVHFDCRRTRREQVLSALFDLEVSLPPIDDIEVDGRIVHLPLSWDDPATRLAIERYMQSVRADAPWCPSNIEFIRRINGLDSVDDVRRIVFEASYLVMGLGDVYLGAPVATPLDPRHRLVTTKYNPARIWTPTNAVGIGGAYLCVYGLEGPGGYQFVGRTVQMWNRYHETREFKAGKRWLLRFFDQLRFYPVSAEELAKLRDDFPYGKVQLSIEPARLRLREYQRFLAENAASIAAFKARQQAAFDAERGRWQSLQDRATDVGAESSDSAPNATAEAVSIALAAGHVAVSAPVSGSVWRLDAQVGGRVERGATLVMLEAMKTEITVQAERAGTVTQVCCRRGQSVTAGDVLLVLGP